MRVLLFPALAAGMLFGLLACSSNTTGGGVGAGTSTGGSSGSCPADLAAAPGSAFCAGEMAAIDCSLVSPGDHDQVCGVALSTPTVPLAQSTEAAMGGPPGSPTYAGSGAPDLSCYQPANYPKLGTPTMVTVSGVAEIFAHGCASTGLSIEAWTVKRTGGADDGALDQQIGTTVVTPMDCTSATTGVQVMTPDCSPRYECIYSLPNVPSETELVIKTYGTGWTPLYDYNNYIATSAIKNGTWTHDVQALASDDYGAIAAAAVGSPITAGNGAIAGEVHDCGDVRLIGATVDVNVARQEQIFYFTTDESDPLPDSSASSTSALPVYAALDVVPGPLSVGALGLVDGKVTTVGYYNVRAYADSVTTLTFSGARPYQISQ